MTHAFELLEQLANVEAQAALINLHFDDLRAKVLTPEIQAELAEIEAERAETMKAVAAGMETLREQVKSAVIHEGATVIGTMFQAVYMKGYAKVHPEVLEFIETGTPSVSIRAAK